MTIERLIVRNAELTGRIVDVVVAGRYIEAVVPAGTSLRRADSADVIDARGGAVLPGLHDHHIHLLALAAADHSLQVGPPRVANQSDLIATLRAEHERLPPGEWIRGIGYHESVAGDIDRTWLDSVGIDRPIRIQHRSGAVWVLSSAALAATGADVAAAPNAEVDNVGRATGRLIRADDWIRVRTPRRDIDLGAVGRRLAAFGITAVTDLTPTADATLLAVVAGAVADGALPFGVTITGSPELPPDASPSLPRGPVKFVLDDADLPSFEWFVDRVRRTHATGRPIAVHCVSRLTLAFLVAVLAETGVLPGDRLEHGAIIPSELFEVLAGLGITVVTQPSFVRDRGDRYLVDVDVVDRPDLWRCRSLLDAGIPVVFGTDAPFGDPDPWAHIQAATERRTRSGLALGPNESVSGPQAVDMFLGTAQEPCSVRLVAAGHRADLCLLDRPLEEQLASPTSEAVIATVVAGRVSFRR